MVAPEDDTNTAGTESVPGPTAPIASPPPREENVTAANLEDACSSYKNGKRLNKPDKIRADRVIELILGCAIVYFAWSQYEITKSNSVSSAKQVDRLIGAAEGIKESAASFSQSAGFINQGVQGAVTNLGLQVKAMGDNAQEAARLANTAEATRQSSQEASTKAIQNSIQIARSDQRAYIYVPIPPKVPDEIQCNNAGSAMCTRFEYLNLGKTPAVAIAVTAFFEYGHQQGGFDEQTMLTMQIPKGSGLQGSIQANSSPGSGVAFIQGINLPRCIQGYHEPSCEDHLYGVIQYDDIFGESHETGFCIVFFEDHMDPPRYCNRGNWFDKRPGVT